MKVVARLRNPRSTPLIKIRPSSLIGLILKVSQSLELLTIKESLIPERVSKIILIAIAEHSAIVSFCKKARYPEHSYKSDYSENCNVFDSLNTNKELYGCLAKYDANTKQFHNNKNKIRNQMKYPKDQNNILLELSKKTKTHRELNKIKKIKKESYDFSNINNSSISKDLNSSDSSVLYLID